jgi:hypothetical protein
VTVIAALWSHFDAGDARFIERRPQEARLADVRQETIYFGELRVFSPRNDDRRQRDHVVVREHSKACYVADKLLHPRTIRRERVNLAVEQHLPHVGVRRHRR